MAMSEALSNQEIQAAWANLAEETTPLNWTHQKPSTKSVRGET